MKFSKIRIQKKRAIYSNYLARTLARLVLGDFDFGVAKRLFFPSQTWLTTQRNLVFILDFPRRKLAGLIINKLDS